MNNKKKVTFLFCAALILGCHNSNTQLKSKVIHNEKTDVYKEGSIFSIKRWEHVQEKITLIKKGMDREDVLKILGKPDGIDYTPSNMIQYSLSYETEGEGWQTISIHILFDNDYRVREIQNNEFVFGPSTLQ